MTSPLRRKHQTTVLNTPGSKTADRRRPLPSIGLGCALLAASLLNAPPLRASDASRSPQPAKIQAAESPDADQSNGDQTIETAKPDSTAADSAHATRLKWLPYESASSLVTDNPQSDDDKPAYSDAAPLRPLRSARVINYPAIVRTQAVQPGSPNSNPFGDEPNQPNAQPLPLPAPTTSDRLPKQIRWRRRARLARRDHASSAIGEAAMPARLNPDLPLEMPTAPSAGPVRHPVYHSEPFGHRRFELHDASKAAARTMRRH